MYTYLCPVIFKSSVYLQLFYIVLYIDIIPWSRSRGGKQIIFYSLHIVYTVPINMVTRTLQG